MRGKKGLSPLIATVLLIAFAVALGTMIMNWSVSAISEDVPEDACAGAQLSIQELPSGSAICYDEETQHIVFLVKNTGTERITNILMRTVDANFDITEETTSANMVPGDIGKFSVSYETTSPNNVSATIIPVIFVDDEPMICPSGEQEQVHLPLC